jgi:hypothetical protein
MRVIFLRTTTTGQDPAGVIVYQNGRLTIDQEAQALADHLLRDVDRSNAQAVEAALRQAPQKYDGAYLRAAVEG